MACIPGEVARLLVHRWTPSVGLSLHRGLRSWSHRVPS